MSFPRAITGIVVSLSFALLSAAGCSVSSSDPEPVDEGPVAPTGTSQGALVVDWTIAGTKDSNQCQEGSVDTIDIIVSGVGGGDFRQTCSAFATTITLPPGEYTANAVLIDADGNERTTEVPIDGFALNGGDQVVAAIDFPSDSFK